MDTLRGHQHAAEEYSTSTDEYDLLSAPEVREVEQDAPPPVIGKDERRMQVRAYNFWASQLSDRQYPDVAQFDPKDAGDFGPHGVLLDFTAGTHNPRVAFLGSALAEECGSTSGPIARLEDVPSRSLLSRITDHYLQILANQAPIGFEAEFVNQRGATILYRGILLPYSSDNSTIDYIYGVINWKELAEQKVAEALLLELDQALEPMPNLRRRAEPSPIADWADGPGAIGYDEVELADYVELQDEVAESAIDRLTPFAEEGNNLETMALGDWLAIARDQAASAADREDRSRNALYEAIGRAWDFALAAAHAPDEFAELLVDAGLTFQDRAPMTPVVKLVFGSDYDKTRLTEYASALTHAKRIGLKRGALAEFLRNAEGGLKGVVAIERGFRREDLGIAPRPESEQPRKALARRLRSLTPRSLASLPAEGDEFSLVMVRRTEAGEVVLLGELSGNVALIERAARQLLD